METKKNEPQIEVFVREVENLGDKMLGKNEGFMIIAYNEKEEGATESSFLMKGKMATIAECLFNIMMNNQALSTAVLVACNAYSQHKMAEAQMEMAAQNAEAAPKETKKRRTKKIIS